MTHDKNCIICGKTLKYEAQSTPQKCEICNSTVISNAICIDGHFVCDTCHSQGTASLTSLFLKSSEKSPIKLIQHAFNLPEIHMHGPEHHIIVPFTLLTAYYNNGGKIDLQSSLQEAYSRAKQVPGGTCAYWGVCGASAGAGIYAIS